MNRRIAASASMMLAVLMAAVLVSPLARADDLRDSVGLDQLIGAQLPPDVPLKDEDGRSVRLGQYFGKGPIVLTFVYFDCPMLCNEVTNAELRTVRALKPGEDAGFEVLSISIDPTDTPEEARMRKRRYLKRYDLGGAESRWHILTGTAEDTRRLAEAAGFRFTYSPETRQFTHAAGLMIVTPEGKLSRYFQGISYPPSDVRLALAEASQGKLGSFTDQVLLFCYQYDPATGRYTLAILNLVRAGCILTMIALGGYLAWALRRDRIRARPRPATS